MELVKPLNHRQTMVYPLSHVKCSKLDHGISREREALEESDLLGAYKGCI